MKIKRPFFIISLVTILALNLLLATHTFTPPKIESKEPTGKTAKLIKSFEGKWDYESLKFQEHTFTLQQFVEIVDKYNSLFTLYHNTKKDFGFIEKKDVPHNSSIFVRADLHGDLNSLIENLKSLQKQKLLDENYKCTKQTYVVFLGDYVDRGYHNLEVLALLACLKMENPNHVFLIRGNHETTKSKEKRIENARINDPMFAECLSDSQTLKKLERFFCTMPLALYIAENTPKKAREYVLFTHTMVELTCDPAPLLDNKSKHRVMPISKERKLSTRLKKAYKNPNATNREALERIMSLIIQETDEIRGLPVFKSTYNWGNLFDETKIGNVDEDEWGLSPKDVEAYLKLSSDKHSVKMLFRGHDHTYKHNTLNNSDEAFVTTLPVGVTSPTAKKRGHSHDVGYLITTSTKVTNWKKQPFLRAPQEIEAVLLPIRPLHDVIH